MINLEQYRSRVAVTRRGRKLNTENVAPTIAVNTGATFVNLSVANKILNTQLQTTDPDNSPAELTYTLVSSLDNGVLKLNGTPLITGQTWTQLNIDSQQLTYDHTDDGTTSDQFTFLVTDGMHISIAGQFTITITPPPNQQPVLINNTGMTVNESSSGNLINTAKLQVTDPDDAPNQLTYTLIIPPGKGNLKLGITTLASDDMFTQADIDAGLLAYAHTASDGATSDTFVFACQDGGENGTQPIAAIFNITITPTAPPSNASPTIAVNNGATFEALSTANTITSGMLQTTDPDNGPVQLVYTLTSAPTNGVLRKNGIVVNVSGTWSQSTINQGNIKYDNTSGATDSFDFSVTDNVNTPLTDTFDITIDVPTATNQQPVLINNTGMTVDELSSGNLITNSRLLVTDPDDGPEYLEYTIVTFPANGTIRSGTDILDGLVSGGPGGSSGDSTGDVLNDNFTQADIDAGLISYSHDNQGTTSDSFTLSCADGGEDGTTPVQITFNVTVTPAGTSTNQQPTLKTNSGMSVLNLSTGNTIGQSRLEVVDTDDTPSQLTYILALAPGNGSLKKNGITMVNNNTFTQADINANLIKYDHTNTGSTTDTFAWSCADGGEDGTEPVTGLFNITVTTIPAGALTPPYSSSGNNRGMNLPANTDFDNFSVFGDVIRQGVWAPDVDPGNVFRKSFNINESSSPQIPSSRGIVYLRGKTGDQFTLRIRQTANYSLPGTASVTILGQTYTSDAIITLTEDVTNTSVLINSINNTVSTWNTVVELWHPGQVGNLFHTAYTTPMQSSGITRFLNWLPVNRQRNNAQPVITSPADMIPLNLPCQVNVQFRSSLDLCFLFADAVDSDAWILIPHTANDALIDYYAVRCRDWKLANPTKRLYLEFSNEMWNGGTFGQANDARDWGKQEWLQLVDGEGNPTETTAQWNVRAQANWAGKYAARCFNRIDQTFTDYISVFAWQAASNATPKFCYDEFVAERTGGLAPHCWAIAPYTDLRTPTQKTFVNSYEQQVVPGAVDQNDVIIAGKTAEVDALISAVWTPEEILVILNTATDNGIARSRQYVKNHFQFATPRGMRLVCYEGGEHLLPRIQYTEYQLAGYPRMVTYPQYSDNFVAASYLAGMKAHLEAMDAMWVQEGGQECVWLVYIQEPRDDSHASFGFRRDMYDDASPKWQGYIQNVNDDIVRAQSLPGW